MTELSNLKMLGEGQSLLLKYGLVSEKTQDRTVICLFKDMVRLTSGKDTVAESLKHLYGAVPCRIRHN